MSVKEDCSGLKLIALHLPKTGGTTLKRLIISAFGKQNVYNDSKLGPDHPLSPMYLDPHGYVESFSGGYPFLRGKSVVRGHFWIKKYEWINRDVPRVTFVRNPIDRLISHYWNDYIFANGMSLENRSLGPLEPLAMRYRAWDRRRRMEGHEPMKAYFMDRRPTIDEYARIPFFGSVYTGTYLRGVDPEIFAFIGDQSRFSEELERLKKLLGIQLPAVARDSNVTADKSPGYREFKERVKGDPALIGKLKDIMKDDIAFYEKYAGR